MEEASSSTQPPSTARAHCKSMAVMVSWDCKVEHYNKTIHFTTAKLIVKYIVKGLNFIQSCGQTSSIHVD